MKSTPIETPYLLAVMMMALTASFALIAEEEPIVDPEHEKALDAQEDAERLQRGAAYLDKLNENAKANDFAFRVVDQDGRPAAGIIVSLTTTRFNSTWIVTGGSPSTSTDQSVVTDAMGMARIHSPIGNRFQAWSSIDKNDADVWGMLGRDDGSNTYFPTGGVPVPEDRRPVGIDYEFRIIRYPSQAPVACWASRVILPPDGSPLDWNPLDPIRVWKDTEWRQKPIDIPGDWPPEFEVRLWRDPAVRMQYLYEPKNLLPDGEKRSPRWRDSKVHWKLTLTARRGSLLLVPKTPLRQGQKPTFPVFDTLPTEGFQPELVWDVDEVAGITPIIWNEPVLVYWRREGIPARVCQMTLTPRFERIIPGTGKPLVKDPDISEYTFSLQAFFRLRPDGERLIALAHDAIPTVDGLRERNSSAITPTWYRWATPAQLAGWLAEPLPVVPAPIKP